MHTACRAEDLSVRSSAQAPYFGCVEGVICVRFCVTVIRGLSVSERRSICSDCMPQSAQVCANSRNSGAI
jgi:hypothetical protein